MSKRGHTPGPWSLTQQGEGDYASHLGEHGSFCITANHGQVVIAQRGGVPTRAAEFVANAHLISAAPDLLDALNSLRNEAVGFLAMADSAAHGQTNLACLQRRIDAADAAIAKAEGAEG